MNIVVTRKELFNNYLIWAGCFLLRVQIGDDLMRCDFGLYKEFDKTVHIDRTQFKVWYNKLGKLVSDKIIRLANGFPTTKKEDDEVRSIPPLNNSLRTVLALLNDMIEN